MIDRARELESPDHAVIATDATGKVVYWGPGAEALYGWKEAEALGCDIVELTPAELSRSDAETIMLTLVAGQTWSGEFLVRSRDGSRFMVEISDRPVHDNSGRLLGIIGSSRRASYLQ